MVRKIDLMDRLKQRHVSTPEEYEQVRFENAMYLRRFTNVLHKACALRMKAYGCKDFKPVGDVNSLAPGTYYLEQVDEVYRRTYAIKQG